MSSHTCYRKTNVVYCLLQSSLASNIKKMKFRGFQFSFKKDMLQMIGKSSEIYCLTIYAYFMMGKQVIYHKLHISEVSIPDQSFTI